MGRRQLELSLVGPLSPCRRKSRVVVQAPGACLTSPERVTVYGGAVGSGQIGPDISGKFLDFEGKFKEIKKIE